MRCPETNWPQSLWPSLPLALLVPVPLAWLLITVWAGACTLLWGDPFMPSLFR